MVGRTRRASKRKERESGERDRGCQLLGYYLTAGGDDGVCIGIHARSETLCGPMIGRVSCANPAHVSDLHTRAHLHVGTTPIQRTSIAQPRDHEGGHGVEAVRAGTMVNEYPIRVLTLCKP